MKTAPIVPARVVFDHPERPGQPYSPDHGDVYRPRDGEFDQAQHVFIAGNGLPARWQQRERFVVLETGFGLGHNFLATWHAWRQDPQRCERLVFISIEKHPPSQDTLASAHAATTVPELVAPLCQAWPPLTHDMHTLSFDDARVTLLLAWGDVSTWLPEIVARIDAFQLDGFTPSRNPDMWEPRLFKACARIAADGATAATWSLARGVHDGLRAAGFEVERAPGFGSRRDMTIARLRPGTRPAQAPGRRAAPACRTALVIGAGLAGASAAASLVRHGVQVTVLERHDAPARETSGNVAGLFHGVLHPQDGTHAQLLRAAALRAAQVYRPLIESGRVTGAIGGLLRGEASGATADEMRGLLAAQGLPPGYVQALDGTVAAATAGCSVLGPAWWYAAGGWLSPALLVQAWLEAEGIMLRTHADVAHITRVEASPGIDAAAPTDRQAPGRWQATDAHGVVLAEADVVVVASASQATRLLADHTDIDTWALGRNRGQVTQVTDDWATRWALPRPRCPLASGGYLVSLPDSLGGGLLCGATSQRDDDDPTLRDADHLSNLGQIGRLTGAALELPDSVPPEALGGRVGWRLVSSDRLPVLGPVPVRVDAGARPGGARSGGGKGLEQARQSERVAGLYVYTALGSRGITLAPLLADALAAWIVGAPAPVGASLLDAIDPARFVARRVRRSMR